MRKLIVNADDFGYTMGVADGIVDAHRHGIVTSSTILINSPHLDVALKKLHAIPSLDLGLHLNITWGKPVSDPSKLKTLLGPDGRFIRRTKFDDVDPNEVKSEWRAQVKKARAMKVPLTHLDSHHHVHMHPALLDIVAEIGLEENVAVRSQETWIRDFLRAGGIRTPDSFIVDFYGDGKTTLEHLQRLLSAIPDGFTEVCCHPAHVDDELRKTSSYNEPRNFEFDVLTDPKLKEWLSKQEISLANFTELPIPARAPDKSCDLQS